MNLVDVASEVVVPALRAHGERFAYPVIQGDVPNVSPEQWSENLRSLLVDFVAESRFGWGENRDVP